LFPIVGLTSMAVAVLSVALAWPVGIHLLWWAAGAIAMILGLSAVRAIRMFSRVRDRRLDMLPNLWLVAVIYDFARALSLVIRVPHRGARPGPRRSQVAA
jgi:hypothetical protein